jgi:hypothetical protein
MARRRATPRLSTLDEPDDGPVASRSASFEAHPVLILRLPAPEGIGEAAVTNPHRGRMRRGVSSQGEHNE